MRKADFEGCLNTIRRSQLFIIEEMGRLKSILVAIFFVNG